MNTPTDNDTSKRLDTNWFKWMVIGLIALIFIFLFQPEIRKIMDRTEDIEFSASKEGVQLKTHHTPIGNVEVSASTADRSDIVEDGLDHNQYFSTTDHFELSWPNTWSPNDKMIQTAQRMTNHLRSASVPLVIARKFQNFTPNVIVAVQNGVNMPITEFVEQNARDVQNSGSSIHSYSVDTSTQGGLLVSTRYIMGLTTYTLQKYVIANGKAYTLTATGLPPIDNLTEDLKMELLDILNSFRLIR